MFKFIYNKYVYTVFYIQYHPKVQTDEWEGYRAVKRNFEYSSNLKQKSTFECKNTAFDI